MIKLLSIAFLLLISLNARENPFFPSEGEIDLPVSSNISQTQEPLKRATITLPSTARMIEEVTIKYKNLDGSIKHTSIVLNNSIDWHLPLFISQNYETTKSVKIVKLEKLVLKQEKFEEVASLEYIKLFTSNKTLKIVTKDRMIRDFLLVKPHRIVCDFDREIDIRSFEKNMKNQNIFRKIRVGNHTGYYRVVIELDGYYRYKLQKVDGAYIFKLL